MRPETMTIDGILNAAGMSIDDYCREKKIDVPRRMLDTAATCDFLGGISRMTLWRLVREGKLPVCRIGRRNVFDPVDLAEFVERTKKRPVRFEKEAATINSTSTEKRYSNLHNASSAASRTKILKFFKKHNSFDR